MAFHTNLPGMLLNNSVSHGEAQPGAFALALARCCFRRKEWIVDALNVFLCNAGTGIGYDDTNTIAVGRGYFKSSAFGHSVACIQEQIQENLLQTSRIAADQR